MAYPQGTQVPFSLLNGGNTPLDAKSIASNKAEALTLAKSARFIGLKIYLLDEKKNISFKMVLKTLTLFLLVVVLGLKL